MVDGGGCQIQNPCMYSGIIMFRSDSEFLRIENEKE